jgi:hydroxyacylglutathione hydrolase
MINIKKFVFNPFQVNCYILYDNKGDCIIVDPSAYFEDEKTKLISYIESKNLKPLMIINTHGHVDHIPGNQFLQEKYPIKTGMHRDDMFLIHNAVEQGLFFGFNINKPPDPDFFLEKNQVLSPLESKLEIRHAPGHSPGSVLIYSVENKMVITGDVLFEGSIGRTDFPGGNYDILIKSIREEIFTLPDDTMVYPGHGPSTVVGDEKRNNPFLQGKFNL